MIFVSVEYPIPNNLNEDDHLAAVKKIFQQ